MCYTSIARGKQYFRGQRILPGSSFNALLGDHAQSPADVQTTHDRQAQVQAVFVDIVSYAEMARARRRPFSSGIDTAITTFGRSGDRTSDHLGEQNTGTLLSTGSMKYMMLEYDAGNILQATWIPRVKETALEAFE